MIPNITKGAKITGLMVYLQGPGKANEHERPRVVGGHESIMARAPRGLLDRDSAVDIANAIDEPRVVFGTRTETTNRRAARASVEQGVAAGVAVADATREVNVWHCSLSLRAEEGELSDEKWAAIATDFMKEMEFDDPDSPRSPTRWVAVRHGKSANGGDHVHIAASVVREDGTRVNTFNDYKRSQQACNMLEHRHGLEVLTSRETQRGTRGVKPAETERARRAGRPETVRDELARTVRACATASTTEAEFVRRLRARHVLVRPRYAKDDTGTVVGYSVAAQPTTAQRAHSRTVVWYGGGRLSKDLTLPRLRDEWVHTDDSRRAALDEWRAARHRHAPTAPGERERATIDPKLVARAAQDIGKWNNYLTSIPTTDTAQWARAAGRTAGVFAAWSARVETTPGPLAAAARTLSDSAQHAAHTRAAVPTRTVSAGGAALIMLQLTTHDATASYMLLLRQLTKTVEAIAAAHRAAGDVRRAHAVESMARTHLATVHRQLQRQTPVASVAVERAVDPRKERAERVAAIDARTDISAEEKAVLKSADLDRSTSHRPAPRPSGPHGSPVRSPEASPTRDTARDTDREVDR